MGKGIKAYFEAERLAQAHLQASMRSKSLVTTRRFADDEPISIPSIMDYIKEREAIKERDRQIMDKD